MFLVFLGKKRGNYQNLSLDIEADSITPEKVRERNHEDYRRTVTWIMTGGDVSLGALLGCAQTVETEGSIG